MGFKPFVARCCGVVDVAQIIVVGMGLNLLHNVIIPSGSCSMCI